MRTSDDHVDVAGYLVGDLTPDEVRAVEEHLQGCVECREEVEALREIQEALGEVPPEALLDGPPEDADLLLQRALRQIRTEASGERTRSSALAAAAAVAVAAALLSGGVLLGRLTGGDAAVVAAPPAPSATGTTSAQAGTRFASGTDAVTGARLTVGVTPAEGWVRVNAAVTGIPEGQPCRLIVVGRDGKREIAGSWLVSEKAVASGVTLDASAVIAPDDVAAVLVENTSGKQFVRVEV